MHIHFLLLMFYYNYYDFINKVAPLAGCISWLPSLGMKQVNLTDTGQHQQSVCLLADPFLYSSAVFLCILLFHNVCDVALYN